MFDALKKHIKKCKVFHPKTDGMSLGDIDNFAVKEEAFLAIWFAILGIPCFLCELDTVIIILTLYASFLHYSLYKHKKWLQQLDR